ncbi:MAG TPA: VOC family protein [Caulobacteraceae bacterium]|nr:VOC family protein [Caulobacteraceae bacterium]
MLNHVSIGVADLARTKRFYDAALSPLGYTQTFSGDGYVAYGGTRTQLYIAQTEHVPAPHPGSGLHFCFDAPDRAAVDAFHAAGLAHGGTDNGAPGLRPQYEPDYYGAFLIDPDGWRVEAYRRG